MGRIKKAATERHLTTLSPFVKDFVRRATECSLHQLPSLLDTFPQHWPLPRGDLYHWIALLDRFDHILELFNTEYALHEGPQAQPFERRLLSKGDAEEGMPYPSSGTGVQELDSLGYSVEGDRELVEEVLHFTRILLEHCGNRSLYASSTHINDLLHTTSLSLLRQCLKLSLRLAQRYQVARYKNPHQSAQAVLLAHHYNLNIDNLHKIAMPFPKPYNSGTPPTQTPAKGKERSPPISTFNTSDLVAIAKEPLPSTVRNDMCNVSMSYYDQSGSASNPAAPAQVLDTSPSTPTPARRPSILGPSRDRPITGDRSNSANDVSTTAKSRETLNVTTSTAPVSFQIAAIKVVATSAWALVKDHSHSVPTDMRYELLNRIRIAKAFASPNDIGQQLLEIRLLAIANLAYALTESRFQERIGIPDGEEPRRFHLASQLCDLLQPATSSQTPLARQTETAVMITLESLTKNRHKITEVAEALAITVNHGILYYELRKVIATLSNEEHFEKKKEMQEAEWRDSMFDLVNSLLQSGPHARYGEKMVSAGIMAILVETLSLRTSRAERVYERVLQFFDSFVHGILTAFQTLAQVKGLDIIAELTAFEVDSALRNARGGNGLPQGHKSKVVDYEIPFYQQSTLRQLFKNTVHMFEHNAGTHDRLLRNLIDTPQVLGALRRVIENAPIFGSNVWSGAVNIVSSFIHNEPTSYQVIGEAGLTRALLETITGKKMPDELPSLGDIVPNLETEKLEVTSVGDPAYPVVDGILPVGEVMCDVPTAFGAMCLSESGMQLFQASGALVRYFDIFLSPVHVRAMEDESQTAATIGHSFDELSRHHPRLKDQIMAAVFNMLKRLRELCAIFAVNQRSGAKLWQVADGKLGIAGGEAALKGAVATDAEGGLFTSSDAPPTWTAKSLEDAGSEDEHERAPAIPYLSACFKFLEGFFHNSSMCSLFCEESGAELVLDLAASPSVPYDLVAFPLFGKITQALKSMCEAKPHLVLPSIIRRTQRATVGLKILTASEARTSSFSKFVDLSEGAQSALPDGLDGTTVLKSLVNTHLLTHVLGRALAPPAYTLRHGSQNNHVFTNLNFTEIYLQLIEDLSKLHASCVWEGLLLMRDVPEQKRAESEPRPFVMRRIDANGIVELAADKTSDTSRTGTNALNIDRDARSRDSILAQKNLKAIRYLLSQVPMGIESFFHSLGQAIVTKRMEPSAKQHAILVADRLALALIWELDFRRNDPSDKALETRYAAGMLTMIGRMLLRNSYSMDAFGTKEALTLVLTKFYFAKGFVKLNEYLSRFVELLAKQQDEHKIEGHVKDAIQSILNFYDQVVRSKSINDASQSSAITMKERNQPDYFQPGQFLVELRDAVLPAISKIWESQNIEKLNDANMRSIVDILRLILKAEGENHALRRSENASRRVLVKSPEFKLRSTDGLDKLTNVLHLETGLSREAIYRCNNNPSTAEAYCRLRLKDPTVPRFHIPQGEPATTDAETASEEPAHAKPQDRVDVEMSSAVEDQESVHMEDANVHADPLADVLDGNAQPIFDNDMGSDDEEDISVGSLGRLPANLRAEDLSAMTDGRMVDILNAIKPGLQGKDTHEKFVTVDDLDDKRKLLRQTLIDRCLDVLSSQPNITFDLSDLIQAAVSKSGDAANPRIEWGMTLVSSLISLQIEEPSKEAGLKIHAYAHLVALIIQDREFFDSTLEELKENFENLVTWVQLEPHQNVEDAPWIEMVLLIIERVLAEDEQPVDVEWVPPAVGNPLKPASLPPLPAPVLPEPVVSTKLRSSLFDALVDILPKIGKNSSLALSVSRTLVILTRRRDLAARLSDKHTLGRLFLMIRQLAGSVDAKIQSSFMLILRHMVEDDDAIRQIMRAEIKIAFYNHRTSRPMDITSYTRALYHLALRSPSIFVSVTQEMLEISRFDDNPDRGQSLALKKDRRPARDEAVPTEASSSVSQTINPEVGKTNESKAPMTESTDGVVQYLLRELSNYKDVEDKALQPVKDTPGDMLSADSGSPDIEMSENPGSNSPAGDSPSKASKPVFKPEEHAIYIYRCFILQCLAELLTCYNKTKIEFINFSRKPETQPATPSKPRSGTLNYLLHTLLPVGTLEHRDDIGHRKKVATSGWANSVLVSLCRKTQERQVHDHNTFEPSEFAEKEPELTFVRKFVLEHALRAFKEATSSSDPLDQRYSRLLAFGELFNRMLNDKDMQRSNVFAASNFSSHEQVGRLMYEKNFIGTLTSAIAELDLNFPNAKRAVKYILSPLKELTAFGVTLSQLSDVHSSVGAAASADDEEEEISSATSQEDHDEREQTPDLFRGSSLGILEGGTRDDESDSAEDEDEDDEMYDEQYDEEMDYEEEQVADHGDVISDDDDELDDIDGLPGDVEIEVDMTMDDDDEDDSEDEDADSSDDDDEGDGLEDDVEFVNQLDEITGDDENASMDEGDDEGDWEDEGMDYDGVVPVHDGGSPHGGPLDHIAHLVGGGEDPSDPDDHDDIVRIDLGTGEDEFFEDEMPPEEDEEDDDGEFAEDIVYEPALEDDEDDEQEGGWAWDARPHPGAVAQVHHHHHHHHHRGFNEMLGMIGGDALRPGSQFRTTHRGPPNMRDEEGINPLLQREGNGHGSQRDREILEIPRLSGRRTFLPRHGDHVLQDLVAAVGAPGNGPGVINVNVDPGAIPALGGLPSMFTVQHGPGGAPHMIDLDPRRPWRENVSMARWPDVIPGGRMTDRGAGSNDEPHAVEYRPSSTSHRWQEEARLLFPGKFQEKAVLVIKMLLRAMVPAAMEAKRIQEEETDRRVAEENAREEARKKAEAEKAEREAQEKKDREEQEAREREEAEARAREDAEAIVPAESAQADSSSMEGVVQESQQAAPMADGPPPMPTADDAPTERITVTLRGRELDITSLGIDREYIEALPEEMREEVIMAQFAEQRHQQAESGEGPSEINRDFLDALPREIQQELLRSEQMERRRRDRDEARRRATQEGAAAQPEEMNNADFMAMLDPALRQAVLMDADEAVLASLPEDLQAEARALFGDRRGPRANQVGRVARGLDAAAARIAGGRGDDTGHGASRPRRPTAQMLDKAGVATLLRLMFVSLNHKPKSNLHDILSDVCKNTQNRAEVISILLSILQDGTADVTAVERSFAQLSLRAKQSFVLKTPQPLKRSLTGEASITPGTELSPLNIVQQCLGTLNALANGNSRVQSFFLNEHETITSQKAKYSKKGKGKENKAVKFPLNALLALLDRKLITENTAVMETLASLLSHVTRPLTILIRRAKEAQEAAKASDKATSDTSRQGEADTEERPQTSASDVPMLEAFSVRPPEDADPSTAENAKRDETAETNPVEAKKKHHDLSPPDVPDENIRLVVNILAARECPSKTFSDTLDIIKNLSAIPGAKEVFGKELIRQAQDLGQALLSDLEELAKQINAAQTGTELQGIALARFSSAGSKQRKLLRVLVALDHLFDPKRTPTVELSSATSSGPDQKLKDDVLATLYDSSTFDELWSGLSTCLTAIRLRGNMINVATILLPLIESLMVVCRNSALKDLPAVLSSPADAAAGTPPPEARMDSLLFKFTDDHRKILNELIRNNPKLMNGNLSVLAKNSKVLEFDNKRNYFSRKLHDRRSEVRAPHPSLQLNIRRDQVFLDSFKSLYYKSGNEIKYGKLNIRFHGEEGIDAGGVTREWFSAMARQMFNPDYALFNPVASDRTTFHPNSLSEVNPEHLMFFKFIGRIIGKALYENRVLDCHFSRAVYRRLLGKSVSLKDMETLDLDYYKSLVWILENDITDVTFETFSIDVDRFGVMETIDLISGGRDIPVTEINKHDYVRLVVDFRLVKSVQAQLDNFLEGFHDIISPELVAIFNEQELELLISGLPDIDVDDWKLNAEYQNYQPTSPQIQWFWRAVRSFDKEEKAKLLQFVTGTSKVPLNGFKELEGMNGFAKFSIHRDYSSKEKLPSSHTCFNQLDLPEYESYEHLRQQLYTAITAGSEYFGFA